MTRNRQLELVGTIEWRLKLDQIDPVLYDACTKVLKSDIYQVFTEYEWV